MNCLCRPSRTLSVRIVLLDDTDYIYDIKDDLPGQAVLDVVFSRLNLIETSYFGIRYIDEENQTHWLDPASRISRQLKCTSEPFDLYFGVKFYAADPCKLLEEITRYQLFLQVKQDVLQGRLPVSFELAAELGAFVVQSELGDYDPRRHSPGYVSEFRLLSNQTCELETRVAELHQQLKGMSPSTAELNYLDKVKWHDMYGVDLHPVLGEDSVEYFLGLTPSGIVVLRNKTTVAHYYWPRIAKVYFKGRYFMLRVCDKNNDVSTYGFETPRKAACKHLWRCCVEHHAFFRLVRVAPMQSQNGSTDFISLGSRFRCSGRTEKQAVKDAMSIGRTPPLFTRIPSKRQPRRVIDDLRRDNPGKSFSSAAAESLSFATKTATSTATRNQEIKTISIPQSFENPYRSTYSIPTTLGIRPYSISNQSTNGGATPDSPRSTRSAPWPRSQQRNLFGNPPSPRSVRSSASATRTSAHHVPTHHQSHHSNNRYRSSSVESHSSNDSRSTRRHRHRHRRTSDNESELSRGSGRSGRSHHSHRKHRRSRHRRDSAGSENDTSRARSYSGHRSVELIDSTHQWREVQRRQAETSGQSSAVQQAAVMKSSQAASKSHHHHHSGSGNSANTDTHSEGHSHHRSRRHKKNRSPSDARNRIWSSELAKHLQFDLVDTTGMSEDQLREIPYTVVETNMKRSGSAGLKVHKTSSNTSSQGKDRVDRIRGLYFQTTNPNDSSGTKNGSIRSASTISSRDCERNSGLVRMMSSMSMGDFISPSGSSLSPLDNAGLRVSHEHTDSGLGADQDYAYSSERSSDSTRYGTNKSSGASSGSHNKSSHFSGPPVGTHLQPHNHSVSSRKPPMYPSNRPPQTTTQSLQKYPQAQPAPVHNSHSYNSPNNNSSNNNNISHTTNIPSSIAAPSASNINSGQSLFKQTVNYASFGVVNNSRIYSGQTQNPPSATSATNNFAGGDSFLEQQHSRVASLFLGDGIKVTRNCKSDIGVPVARQHRANNSVASTNANKYFANNLYTQKSKMPSVKSEFVLSYVNDSQNYLMSSIPSNCSSQPIAYHISGRCNTSTSSGNLSQFYINSKPMPSTSKSISEIGSNQGQSSYLNYQANSSVNNSAIGPLLYFEENGSGKMKSVQQHQDTQREKRDQNQFMVGGGGATTHLLQKNIQDRLSETKTRSSPPSCTEGFMGKSNSSSSTVSNNTTAVIPTHNSISSIADTHQQKHQQQMAPALPPSSTPSINPSADIFISNDFRSSSLELILTPLIQSTSRRQQ